MAKFRTRSAFIEATRWYKNGDHPQDNCLSLSDGNFLTEGKVVRYYRRPDDPGTRECQACEITMHNHGWIDRPGGGIDVCPGDWIITDAHSFGVPRYYACTNSIFEAMYEEVTDE